MDIDKIDPSLKNMALLSVIAVGPLLSIIFDLVVFGRIVKYLKYGGHLDYSFFGASLIVLWALAWAAAMLPASFVYANETNPLKRWISYSPERQALFIRYLNIMLLVAVSFLVVGWLSQW